jgi:hypothetical protein
LDAVRLYSKCPLRIGRLYITRELIKMTYRLHYSEGILKLNIVYKHYTCKIYLMKINIFFLIYVYLLSLNIDFHVINYIAI